MYCGAILFPVYSQFRSLLKCFAMVIRISSSDSKIYLCMSLILSEVTY